MISSGKKQRPLVSVLVTTYNHEEYLTRCLDSILNQKTDFSYEVIVHDDASTDGTIDILHEYESRNAEKLTVIYEEENQYSQHLPILAKSFAKASGKYFAFCEGDDYWTSIQKLQMQADFLEGNPSYSAVYHNCCFVDGEDNSIRDYYGIYHHKNDSDYGFWDFACGNQYPGQTASLMIRADCYGNTSEVSRKVMNEVRANGDARRIVAALTVGRIRVLSDTMSAYRVVTDAGDSWSASNCNRNNSAVVFASEKDFKRFFNHELGIDYPNDYKLFHSGVACLIKPILRRSSENRLVRKCFMDEFSSKKECARYLCMCGIRAILIKALGQKRWEQKWVKQ